MPHLLQQGKWIEYFTEDHFAPNDGTSQELTIESGYHAIVGYAIVKHGRILELMTDGSREDIIPDLLERICSDVIEQKDVPVRLDAPDGDPLHELMKEAGGEFLRLSLIHI